MTQLYDIEWRSLDDSQIYDVQSLDTALTKTEADWEYAVNVQIWGGKFSFHIVPSEERSEQ